ncbi:hypothetical protein CLLU_23470 [Clostridium luticellarii]|uniref:Carotenoid biosynthesis protein n=2 Tax=Clostridium luticellarii TaxID=1691940 RepID=A0A2T0BLF1_9CLOT|nr:carotenoid biosynthesis protein [Clostridium luticellarii]PRR84663.1 hypothetical protein CLLU_23470 [Clostridium luticellarii]
MPRIYSYFFPASLFFALTFVISWSYETLSIYTGFPFGHYHYTDHYTDLIGPKLGVVPIFIMFSYFAVGYLSWMIGQVLLDRQNSKFGGADVFTIPVFSAFVMVLWDLCFDPFASTVRQGWIWENGGGFFGVPIGNYLGWFLCTYTFFQLFALYLKFCFYKNNGDKNEQTRNLWLMPCLMYGAVALQHLLVIFSGGGDATVTTLDGRSWIVGDIKETLTTICIFTMVFISALSSAKVLAKTSASGNK